MQLQNMNTGNVNPLSTLLTIVIPVRVDSAAVSYTHLTLPTKA